MASCYRYALPVRIHGRISTKADELIARLHCVLLAELCRREDHKPSYLPMKQYHFLHCRLFQWKLQLCADMWAVSILGICGVRRHGSILQWSSSADSTAGDFCGWIQIYSSHYLDEHWAPLAVNGIMICGFIVASRVRPRS